MPVKDFTYLELLEEEEELELLDDELLEESWNDGINSCCSLAAPF